MQASSEKRILILCTGNSARSQMAEGILRSFDSRLRVFSAGTRPAQTIHPKVIPVMKEIGIDMSYAKPKNVSEFLGQSFDFVITVCDDADKDCPLFTGLVRKRLHIGFTDPAKVTDSEEAMTTVFRQVRDAIKSNFADFYNREIKPEVR